jgi:hypothetical protein
MTLKENSKKKPRKNSKGIRKDTRSPRNNTSLSKQSKKEKT